MAGAFFVFEGIDGSGKSTLCESIRNVLTDDGYSVRVTQEPTCDGIGALIRSGSIKGISQKAEALLFVADRAVHTEQISDWVDDGDIVLCDRYFASTVAYQSAPLNGAYVDREWLIDMNMPVIRVPDRTFLLDVDTATSLDRVSARGSKSKFEDEGYLRCVRRNYLDLAERFGFTVVNADQGKSRVLGEVLGILRELI